MLNSNLMRNILYMSLAIWCGFPFAAIAQTACPNGVAPGSPQCGPDSGTSRANPAPPQPTGRWIKTWGPWLRTPLGTWGFPLEKLRGITLRQRLLVAANLLELEVAKFLKLLIINAFLPQFPRLVRQALLSHLRKRKHQAWLMKNAKKVSLACVK